MFVLARFSAPIRTSPQWFFLVSLQIPAMLKVGLRPPKECPCGAQIGARCANLLRKLASVKARHFSRAPPCTRQGAALHPAGRCPAPARGDNLPWTPWHSILTSINLTSHIQNSRESTPSRPLFQAIVCRVRIPYLPTVKATQSDQDLREPTS